MNEIILEISAFCVALFCIVDCFKNRKELYLPIPKGFANKIGDQHFTYLALLISLMVSAFCSSVEIAMEEYMIQSKVILYILNEIYYLFHTSLPLFFALYIVNMTDAGSGRKKKFFYYVSAPSLAGLLLVVLNPITKMIFYINENYTYQRGDYLWVLYAIGVCYIVMGIIFFAIFKNKLSKMDRSASIILIMIAVLGICIQAFFSITVELFFESVCFLGFKVLLEDSRIRERSGKASRISKSFIVVIALIFLTVIAMNISLIYHAGTDQTEQIGKIQVDSIKGDLQETISDAEGNLLRISMGMEQLMSEKASLSVLEEYVSQQQQYYYDLSNGNCFNVYAASSGWSIIPAFDMPEEYHATERVWYLGAKQNAGKIYISEPYVDAATGDLCFTLSYLLSDGDSVLSMDYTLSKVQDSIQKMGGDDNQLAIIVTEQGTIVGCSDTELQGQILSEVLPKYMDVFERVKASNEHRSFTTKIDGSNKIIFSSETGNGWQLILGVDSDSFYSAIYNQMIMLGAIDLLMVAVIVVFYMMSLNNQERVESTLVATEGFISGLAEDLKKPVDKIAKLTEDSFKDDADTLGLLREIRESVKRLQEKMENLVSYSGILKGNMYDGNSKKLNRVKKASVSSRYIRNGIIGILMIALLIGLALCLGTSTRWGQTRISKEADKYTSELTQWMQQQQSILRMFTDVIAADPSVLDDYDEAVSWLNDIAQNYSEMSFCYMANPYKEHAVIMNNGWVPDPDYKVEERQWYIDTERSGDGYSISVPYFDAQTGLYCITFSRIVYSKDGDFLGIFAIDCYLDKLVDILDDSYSSEGYAFLVDQDGTIINHPDKKYEITSESSVNIEDTEYADVYHKGDVFGMKDYDGRLVSCYTEKSSMSGFTVVVVQSWWSIYGTVLFMTLIFLLMIGVSIVSVAVLINRFINWQEETNEKLVEAAETAVNAGKAKSRFLAQMSHEIRTPINAVLGMNEMILRESNDESIRDYAVNIQTAGKNLLGLINTILDFSKIEEGKMEIIPVRYDTSTMIGNIVNSISSRAKEKGLTFEAHIDSDIPSVLYGDDMRVSQVAINLLTNAVKYTRSGRVDLYITGKMKDEETLSLGVRVKDTGIGIKEEDLGKLFESFTRLDEKKNRNIEGTGLGMSIVIRLLDMMGSGLNVNSKYGEGSEFSFEVDQPVVDKTPIGDYEQRMREEAEKREEDRYVYAPKARLLIVDDNDMNLKVIKNLLKQNGIVPDLAESGAETIEKLKDNTYDIVLLDHMMPGMDGVETLKKAKEENLIHEGETVIALTANAVVGARERYLDIGFDDYLSKPVEIAALEDALAKYLPSEIVEYRSRSEENKDNKEVKEVKEPESQADDEILEFFPDEETDESVSENRDMKDVCKILEENGINTTEGKGFCGKDDDFYREILQDYTNTSETRIDELNSAYEAGDIKMYEVKSHSLKSMAKTVGDTKVFEMAKALEEAAKASDIDKIKADHQSLIDEYTRKAGIVKNAL